MCSVLNGAHLPKIHVTTWHVLYSEKTWTEAIPRCEISYVTAIWLNVISSFEFFKAQETDVNLLGTGSLCQFQTNN